MPVDALVMLGSSAAVGIEREIGRMLESLQSEWDLLSAKPTEQMIPSNDIY